MDHKKIAVAVLLSLVILSSANAIYAGDDRDYSIIDSLIELTINSNGLLHVNESYTYSFDGTFNGVYRDIPLKEGESIDNISVYIDGAYGTYEESESNGQKHLKVYLWADKAHTKKIHDQEVTITYSYDMKNVVTLYNDIGSLQYKLWGENWDCDVEHLKTIVHLPGSNDINYYLNPEYYNLSDSINGNIITAETTKIPSGEFYELQVLMPLSDFTDAQYAKHVNVDGKDQIMQKQAEYKGSVSFWGTVFTVLSAIGILSPLSLVYAYLKYGREPKVNYEGIYERELPTDDPPAMVNALIDNKSNIGEPNLKGFEATIMDLIDRKVFKMHVEEGEHTKDLILEFDESKYDSLAKHEQTVYNTLENFSDNGLLNVSKLSSQLNNETSGKYFERKFEQWKDDIANEYLGKERISEYFNDAGSTFGSGFTVGGVLLAVIFGAVSMFSNHPSSGLLMIGAVVLGVFSIGVSFLPEDILGQWTPEGRVYYLKWNNFKKFLKDNSLINEHPPESIVIWNKYLVYGTALGVADEVYKAMKLHVPKIHDDDYYYGDLYWFHSYAGLSMLNSAFNDGISAANPSSSGGGFGGVGGGSGGGGGGAF
ncbi:DUF2207 domain-containing protein [Methanobrevibacter millerae]|uniref:Uncharacterized membrane protein n=1 Tax=Methanobrevibacter millerae TaxID=230361 RepID=A0A1G5X8H0_9EURY|nr:DUF2207 domain-containing protein [Methanobrevibacter millerae]SDA66552.1 Uncharacterized membrane protein [Methanobrevibacter millerae]